VIENTYIVNAMRTAIGSLGGTAGKLTASELAVAVTRQVLEQCQLSPDAVDEVLMGNVLQAGQGQNVARQVAIGAGVPPTKTAMTINMVCGSGLRSVADAAIQIQCGNAELIVAGGTESMSRAPFISPTMRHGRTLGHTELLDSLIVDGLWDVFGDYHMGITAENIAEQYGITRREQDEFAARSQQKTEAAQNEGRFIDEIVPLAIPQRNKNPLSFSVDEFPRTGVTVESISHLKPAFKPDGTVTAGNSSGISDGAACVLVASEEAVRRNHLQPMARIVSYAWAGVEPEIMGIGPVPATRLATEKAGWNLPDIELVELNEAFAAQSIAVLRELELPADIVNVSGGAIALGHPIGASGCRILVTLLHEMKRRRLSRGLATMCIGGGMGIAMTVESCT